MPKINRPAKALGTFNYADEVAQGKLDIIDAEIDLDFNTLYQGINNLDGTNFNPSPTTKLTCAQLDLTNCIKNADIRAPAGSPIGTTGGINANKLYGTLPFSFAGVFVDGRSIIAQTIPHSVSASPFDTDAVVIANSALHPIPITNDIHVTGTQLLAETSFAGRGGSLVWVIGTFGGIATWSSPANQVTLTLRNGAVGFGDSVLGFTIFTLPDTGNAGTLQSGPMSATVIAAYRLTGTPDQTVNDATTHIRLAIEQSVAPTPFSILHINSCAIQLVQLP